jgi:hypothetical protein
MSLGLYFTVLDAGGQVLTDAVVVDAEVAMEDGWVYDAAVAKPSPETYVVLVLDGSGSMVARSASCDWRPSRPYRPRRKRLRSPSSSLTTG